VLACSCVHEVIKRRRKKKIETFSSLSNLKSWFFFHPLNDYASYILNGICIYISKGRFDRLVRVRSFV
jgi:hypothetical protein